MLIEKELNPISSIDPIAEERANHGSVKAILTQESPEKITEDMIKEKLGTEADKFKDWLKSLPPELWEQAYYWIITYLEQARISYEEIKRMLDQGIYVTTLQEIKNSADTPIGHIDVLRMPGDKQFVYRGKTIDEAVVAKYNDTYILLEKEDLPYQYKELKEDGYQEIFYIHKEDDKLVIEKLDDKQGDTFLGSDIRSYMWAKDSEGEHVIEFRYVKEGNPVTYFRVDNGEWTLLKDTAQLKDFKDELGRPLSDLFTKENGFIYPLDAFKSTYVDGKILEGAQVSSSPSFLIDEPIPLFEKGEKISDQEFNERFKKAIKKVYENTGALPMSLVEAENILRSNGFTDDQVESVIWFSQGDEVILGRLVNELLKTPKKSEETPVLKSKVIFQAYLNYLSNEKTPEIENVPPDVKEKAQAGIEAIAQMDWTIDKKKLEPYVIEMLLNSKK